MKNNFISDIFRFFGLILLQILILNNIQLGGYINPYLYILFFIMFSFDVAPWIVLFLAFFMGATIDMFSNTGGIHAAATVLIAFARPYLIRIMVPRDDFDKFPQGTIRDLGLPRFLSFSLFMTLIHHTALFYLEMFTFSNFFQTLSRVILSSIFTMLLIWLSQQMTSKPKNLKLK